MVLDKKVKWRVLFDEPVILGTGSTSITDETFMISTSGTKLWSSESSKNYKWRKILE